MAVTQNPLIGRSRGSVGGVTFTKWKGLNVIKAKAESVEQPNTIAQQTQKNRMLLMTPLARGIKPVIDVGFKEQAINMSEYNAFTKENLMNAIDVTVAPAVEFDYSDLAVSKGSLSNSPVSDAVSADGSADIVVTYPDAVNAPDQAGTDLAIAVAINTTQGTMGYNIANDTRADGTCTIVMPSNAATGDEIETYLFFAKEDYSKTSDSQYLQEVTP